MSDAPDDYILAENLQTVLSNALKQPHWCTASDHLVSATRPTPTLAEALAVPEVAAMIKLMKGALGDIHNGEPEWPDDAAKELEWCRNRARAALAAIKRP
jgi:hypothetical protein